MRSPSCRQSYGLFLGVAMCVGFTILCGATWAHAAEPKTPPQIVMILTNIDRIPGTDRETGFWAEEFVVPHELFRKAGFDVMVASIKGGMPPVDRASLDAAAVGDAAAARFKDYLERNRAALQSVPLQTVAPQDVAAVFVVGGHGVMFDLSSSQPMHVLARRTLRSGRVLAAVCHGPGALANAKDEHGEYLLHSRNVTGFSAREEELVGMSTLVPYCLEETLKKATGGKYEKAPEPWQSHVVVDGNLVTGQNPASSEATAKAVIRMVEFMRLW